MYTQSETEVTKGCKVVICDDHPQMRGGVRNVLVGMLGCQVVGEAARGEEAIALLELHRPDMLVLDLSLPGAMKGRDVLAEIRRRRLPTKVFVHSAYLNRDDFEEWIDDPDGPDGIDEKGTGDKELAIGFTQVLLTDQRYIPLRLVKRFGNPGDGSGLDRLTPKELQVLKLAIRPELDTRTIAKQLNYTSATVRSYLTTVYDKLGLENHNRAALIAFYYAHRG
ncbi:MAG: response regulator transcription factor [Chloroflexi bacterium]|nr:response regulator transcription factor [Chloroflexota bacterium]